MKKILIVILVIALLLPLFTVAAFAADDDSATNSGLLDGMGGFFRGLGTRITSLGTAILSGMKRMVESIGGFIADLSKTISDGFSYVVNKVVKAISTAVSFILKGIFELFVPRKDYFESVLSELNKALSDKFGGLTYLLKYFKDRFSGLSANKTARSLFSINFPSGHIFGGTSLDLLSTVDDIIRFFRPVLSFLIVAMTANYAYKRVQSMIDT